MGGYIIRKGLSQGNVTPPPQKKEITLPLISSMEWTEIFLIFFVYLSVLVDQCVRVVLAREKDF